MTILRSLGALEPAGHAQALRLGVKTQLTLTQTKTQQKGGNAEMAWGAFRLARPKSAPANHMVHRHRICACVAWERMGRAKVRQNAIVVSQMGSKEMAHMA